MDLDNRSRALGFVRPNYLTTANSIRALEYSHTFAVPARIRNKCTLLGDGVSLLIDELLTEGSLKTVLVPNLPRQFRPAVPLLGRLHVTGDTRLNHRLAEQLKKRADIPLVARRVYYVPENEHIVNRLVSLHESEISTGHPFETFSPLVTQLRLAQFFAEHAARLSGEIDIEAIFTRNEARAVVRPIKAQKIPWAPIPDEVLDGNTWPDLNAKTMLDWPTFPLTVEIISPADASRIAEAMLYVDRDSLVSKREVLAVRIDSLLSNIFRYRQEAHLFLASC